MQQHTVKPHYNEYWYNELPVTMMLVIISTAMKAVLSIYVYHKLFNMTKLLLCQTDFATMMF